MFFDLAGIYKNSILNKPKVVCFIIFLMTVFFASHIPNFRLDASSDTLVLENDNALKFYREIKQQYGSDDFLIMTYTPKNDLFAQSTIDDLIKMSERLMKVNQLESIISVLNVPLINSPPVTLKSLVDHIPTLLDPNINKNLAKKELLISPLFKNLLISSDSKTTALLLYIKPDKANQLLQQKRIYLKKNIQEEPSSNVIKKQLNNINTLYSAHLKVMQNKQAQLITDVRQIMALHSDNAQLHLGGVPMITSDSIAFIRHDLINFGLVVVLFILLTLSIAFAKVRWVVLPLLCCIVSGIIMVGFLGLVDWPVTIVSSNFISLMLILTLSLTIHLIVRYQELHWKYPQVSQFTLVSKTIQKKFVPCLFTTATTIVAFGSLVVSDIRPVIDFGWMMTIGVSIAFLMAFTLFPAALMLLKPGKVVNQKNLTEQLTLSFAKKLIKVQVPVLVLYFIIIAISIFGFRYLSVENRFIDYFKPSTEIHQGMSLIDNKLGGTTPLDVVINAPIEPTIEKRDPNIAEDIEDDFFDEFGFEEDEFNELEQNKPTGITASYWFNPVMLEEVAQYHKFLDKLPQTGKILSLASGMQLINDLEPETKTDNFKLSLIYSKLPDSVKSVLFDPYLSENGNQIRFSIRVFESDKNLKRDELLKNIKRGLVNKFDLKEEQIQLTGMLVLYNNMLKSLFSSQIQTLGMVFFSILIMFVLLYKNISLSLITLIPNLVAASMVLSIMGWFSIPLDMMTITIASICVGIAVDNSIHYVHRFKIEYQLCGDYEQAIIKSHSSIGRAMYYTSITITLGFSILIFSNFMPSIYFGLLTGFSMIFALISNLSLLPLLLIKFKPLGDNTCQPKSIENQVLN
ncbi:transporter [Pseudoalteromonas sp. NBT06-2]|uniref:efflux RND transporter permease subunit n=1 Tax=Pseudoalteromonas sp. NBT06-2 TaxID=2025950 RepID=UPI000BA6ECE7|nr:MMPL family transporter [Pseudoalteromonas sp. NBT06-2]PAJ73987.1 transporter [Pseudoalteromonas sp. NBT06-2]